MAFVATLTGTGRNCTLTSGSATMTVSSNSGLVVGATIQGTGIPTGTKINSISGTTVVMSANATASGTQSLIFSSVFGSTLTIQATASGDAPTWQNVFNAGFGTLQGSRSLFHPGALTIVFGSIVAGARFDHQDWTVEIGTGGRMLFDSGLLAGEQRGGYFVAGTLLIKTDGPTFVFNNFNNSGVGGSSLFLNTGGLLTQGGLFRMHDARFVVRTGNNMCPAFTSVRDLMDVENLIMDYEGDTGPNASIGCGYGTILNPKIIKANSGISRTNANSIGTISGLYYLGLFTDNPAAKFTIPNNSIMDGYAPQISSTQNFGGFVFGTSSTETYSNINLSSAGYGLSNIPTKYLRFGGPYEIRFPRTVSFEFNDSTGADLTGVTLYIRSGAISVINAVQAGDYSALTQGIVLNWTSSVNAYRVANTTTNTIAQVAQVRKYGFIEQSTSYSINLNPYSQPFFMLPETALSGISEATASAITTAGINWSTKTITPTGNLSYDQINARLAWELAQTTNSAQADPRTITGSNLTLATGWSLVVNTGITISAGTNLTYMYVPTITLNGTGQITGVYASTSGTSTTWEFQNVEVGTSLAIYDGSGVTKYFQGEVTTAGTYRYYIPPMATGVPYFYAIEKYGTRRETGSFPSNAGGVLFYVPSYAEDVGISVTNKATVAAYTEVDNLDKLYDRVAYFRLSEVGIKLGQIATRSGTAVDIGNFSLLVNQSASVVLTATSSLITIKALSFANGSKFSLITATPPKTVTANTNEVITAAIEDANGDSSVNIQGGSGDFTLWKITNATSEDDFATGTNLGNVTNTTFRFLNAPGFKIVIRDNITSFRQVVPMDKGIYTRGLFFGDQVQLAQSAEVTQINTKVDILQVDIERVIKKENIIIGLTA